MTEGNMALRYRKINWMEVVTGERHHHMLEAWGKYRKTVTEPPYLITFDCHTDFFTAFSREIAKVCNERHYNMAFTEILTSRSPYIPSSNESEIIEAKLISSLYNMKSGISSENVIMKLSNDEHLDAAKKCRIISDIVLVCSGNVCDFPEKFANVFEVSTIIQDRFKLLAETVLLNVFIRFVEETLQAKLEEIDYILDFDLDYFRSKESINPSCTKALYELISKASLVTIAKERDFVEDEGLSCADETDPGRADIFLEIMLTHIKNATTQC